MDEGKEIKQQDDSLLSKTRRDLQLGIPPNAEFSRRFLSFAKMGHVSSQKPKAAKEPSINTSPWRYLQGINSLFRKKEEPVRVPEDIQN